MKSQSDFTNNDHVLMTLHNKTLNDYTLILKEVKKLRFSGWRGFKLHLQDPSGNLSTYPVIKGIYSGGGKDGVKPWIDLNYNEEIEFQVEKSHKSITLSQENLDQKLFQILGDIILPGGHLMVSYEDEQKIHTETMKSLSFGVPPAITPLGHLIFLAGFQWIKDWYLAEGGFEGPRKLWGEKAPDQEWVRILLERTEQQVSHFLEKKSQSIPEELSKAALQKGREIIDFISRH